VLSFIDPGRLVFVTPRRAEDLLWSMEEVLRAGAVPLVVADLPAPPALTPVRRLQLAAETGAAEGRLIPLGILLAPGPGGAAGTESRWEMTPRHTGTDHAGLSWHLHRRRARTAPEAAWTVDRGADGLHLAP
jgi:protein ImuA